MVVKVQRRLVMAGVMAATLGVLAGCGATGGPFDRGQKSPGMPKFTAAEGAPAPVVTGNCPQVSLRDGTSFLRKYAGNAKDNPEKLIFQASLAESTRQCTVNESAMTITVMAQGRLVAGPAGKAGVYTLPIRVAVIEGEKTVFTDLVKFQAEIPAGQGTAQFLFSKNDVVIPGGISGTARIFLGFDEGPYNTK